MKSAQLSKKNLTALGLSAWLFGCAFSEMKVVPEEQGGAAFEHSSGGSGNVARTTASGGASEHFVSGGSSHSGAGGRVLLNTTSTGTYPAAGGVGGATRNSGGDAGSGGASAPEVGSLGGTGARSNLGGASFGGTANTAGTGNTSGVSPCAIQVVPMTPKSCATPLTCGKESCCTALAVPGGTFPMGRSTSSASSDYYPSADLQEIPEHLATVSPFVLDKYEVTVGRFRAFVAAYSPWVPSLEAGAKPGTELTGWGQSWALAAAELPATREALKASLNCYADHQTWTDFPGANENAPINCVTWPLAFAFCIWDGGRLPTEAEWEYAAAGAKENRLYPWGSASPDDSRAVYTDTNAGIYGKPTDEVGSKPLGMGCFGHLDMAGSMWEWVFDWYSINYYGTTSAPRPCQDCANVDGANSPGRSIRGGCWQTGPQDHRAANRWRDPQAANVVQLGFRCARN
jgi:formylglycine-generating enzyme required for sulfatase activity